MSSNLKDIENSALSLNSRDKVRLADTLLKSIQGEVNPEIEKAWKDEVHKRKESLKSGDASLHSASEVLNEARKRLKK